MDRERALDSLAPVYARALRLAAGGWAHPAIADDLGIDPDAVAGLLQIGTEKLARALAEGDRAGAGMDEDDEAPDRG